MISWMTTVAMTDRSAVATCPLGISFHATGLSAPALPVLAIRERNERPTQAPAVAATAQARTAYAFAAAANGAGAGTAKGGNAANGQQKKQHGSTKWAFRGLEPWSDPA